MQITELMMREAAQAKPFAMAGCSGGSGCIGFRPPHGRRFASAALNARLGTSTVGTEAPPWVGL